MAETPISLVHIVVLALIQGITEFLPISSSAHLILVPAVAGWRDQGVEIDVAAHVGTLGAVVIYFRRDFGMVLAGIGDGLAARATPARALVFKLLLATLPLLLIASGVVAFDLVRVLRQPEVIAWATILLALVLYAVDKRAPADRDLAQLTYGGALIVGVFQAVALVPGASRAGVSITGGRLLGLSRVDAARFSMLLSVPAILAAGGYAVFGLASRGDVTLGWQALVAAALAFLAALGAIDLLMRWVRRSDYTPFVIYRLVLGGALLWWVYGA